MEEVLGQTGMFLKVLCSPNRRPHLGTLQAQTVGTLLVESHACLPLLPSLVEGRT